MNAAQLQAKVRQIEIRTRRLVSDTMVGQYQSVFKGQGMDFDEVREYMPGDEVRNIDWNVTARKVVDSLYVDDKVKDYIVSLVCATRDPEGYGVPAQHLIQLGASPRATIFLTLGAKAHAFVQGRGYVTPQDVKSIAMDVLRHRVHITYEAEAEEQTTEDVVRLLLDHLPVP